jgi:hypothetical protein
MGYTHYWKQARDIDIGEWVAITTIARTITRIAQDDWGIALSEDLDFNRIPVINEDEIRFNGYGDEGHETFVITREAHEDFCKTARNPYDAVVVAILQACGVYATGFSWTSDGDYREDHADGIRLYNEATGANWDYSNVTERKA